MLVNPANDIPTTNSTSNDWINWYDSLDYYFTKQESNYWFLKAWNKRGSSDANDSKLRSFLKSKGIQLDADLSDFEFLSNPFGITDWFKNQANMLFIGLGVVFIAAFLIAWRLSKNVQLQVPMI